MNQLDNPFIKRSIKLVKSNNVVSTDADAINLVKSLYDVVDGMRLRLPTEQRRLVTDDHIPAMSLLYIAQPNLELLQHEYRSYITATKMSSRNELGKRFNKALEEIKDKKMFSISKEKSDLINTYFSKFVEDVHLHAVVDDDDDDGDLGEEDIVYEDKHIVIRLADSRRKCIKYGKSNLCISWKGSNNYYWRYRMGEQRSDGDGMSTYFVSHKKTNDLILIDALGDEDGPSNKFSYNTVSPNNDCDASKDEIIKKYPYLKIPFAKKIFKFIPYGEEEKRFQYIENNIKSILSDELKTREDYWMFIECGKKISENEWEKIPEALLKDVIIKYASVAANFNIPQSIKDIMIPSDLRNYLEQYLEAAKKYAAKL